MTKTYDAVVLGAGIVGAACALELARAGLRIAVVEREGIAAGATGAAMGHVVVMNDSDAQFALTRYSQELWQELAGELPEEVGYFRPGTIWVAADEVEMAAVREKHAFYSGHGVPSEVLDGQALAEAEPNLRRPLAGGLRMLADAVLVPDRAAAYLIEKARRQRAEVDLLLGHGAVKAGDGWVRLEDGTEIGSPIIVNATGCFAEALMPGIAIRKRKGLLKMTESYPEFMRHQLVELGYLQSAHSSEADSVAFNVQPRRNGQLLIGSSRQYGAEGPEIEERMVAAMLERACLYMPGLADLKVVRMWTGFRAATQDKLPLIGPTADATVFLATGHEGLGITTSLGTARLLADYLLGRTSAIPIEPYLPGRLALRAVTNLSMEGNEG